MPVWNAIPWRQTAAYYFISKLACQDKRFWDCPGATANQPLQQLPVAGAGHRGTVVTIVARVAAATAEAAEAAPSHHSNRGTLDRVQRLVQRMQGQSGDKPQEEEEQADTLAQQEPAEGAEPERTTPRRLVRTCVASMADCRAFAPMVAAEAQERGFYRAKKRAFLGDGAAYNWGIALIPAAYLTPMVVLGYAPGSANLSFNYSAAWVAPESGTTIYVDRDGDTTTGANTASSTSSSASTRIWYRALRRRSNPLKETVKKCLS